MEDYGFKEDYRDRVAESRTRKHIESCAKAHSKRKSKRKH